MAKNTKSRSNRSMNTMQLLILFISSFLTFAFLSVISFPLYAALLWAYVRGDMATIILSILYVTINGSVAFLVPWFLIKKKYGKKKANFLFFFWVGILCIIFMFLLVNGFLGWT